MSGNWIIPGYFGQLGLKRRGRHQRAVRHRMLHMRLGQRPCYRIGPPRSQVSDIIRFFREVFTGAADLQPEGNVYGVCIKDSP